MNWGWIWPGTGAAPTNDEPDAEIFDTEKVPLAHTFVREAVQNSLDACGDINGRVRMRFSFGSKSMGPQMDFLAGLEEPRRVAGLGWPSDWEEEGRVSWLAVEDFGTTGLLGSLDDRKSDFWNYWLNFGLSNKTGSGRGGRGVGRKTFLLASGVRAVIGFTRRTDGISAVCGYAMMRPDQYQGRMRASLAILADRENGDVYALHPASQIVQSLTDAFDISQRDDSAMAGFSLIVPFPQESITADSIIAALIENFAPAIMKGSLEAKVDGKILDASSIDARSSEVASSFAGNDFRTRHLDILRMLRLFEAKPDIEISIDEPGRRKRVKEVAGKAKIASMRQRLVDSGHVTLMLQFPLVRGGREHKAAVRAVLSICPEGAEAIDVFYRSGMRLPDVRTRNTRQIDLVTAVDHGQLATYLNFCEGKAHLDLLENEEVRRKLGEAGFSDGIAIRRLIKRFPEELRELVAPDSDEPDASVFSRFFRAPVKRGEPGGAGARKRKSIAPIDPPPPRERIFSVTETSDGFVVSANDARAHELRGRNVRIRTAYANGGRKLDWNSLDFDLGRKPIVATATGCEAFEAKGNTLVARNCSEDLRIEVRGFDPRRELETDIRLLETRRDDA